MGRAHIILHTETWSALTGCAMRRYGHTCKASCLLSIPAGDKIHNVTPKRLNGRFRHCHKGQLMLGVCNCASTDVWKHSKASRAPNHKLISQMLSKKSNTGTLSYSQPQQTLFCWHLGSGKIVIVCEWMPVANICINDTIHYSQNVLYSFFRNAFLPHEKKGAIFTF